MNIGEQINHLRKKNGLSQDDFANLFNVSRQTVSNWENGKSYPDLEMIINISNHFKVSVDELLKNDTNAVEKIDSEKKKKKFYIVMLIMFLVLGCLIIIGLYAKYQDSKSVNFTMKKHETYTGNDVKCSSMNIANGFFSVPQNEKLEIQLEASTDDGKLHILITDKSDNVYYQLDGQELEDLQTLYFDKGSYMIQIVADDYSEKVIAIGYDIKVQNR